MGMLEKNTSVSLDTVYRGILSSFSKISKEYKNSLDCLMLKNRGYGVWTPDLNFKGSHDETPHHGIPSKYVKCWKKIVKKNLK